MGDRTDAKRCRTRLAINRARHYSQPYSVIAVETDGRLEYASVDDTHDQPPSSCCICRMTATLLCRKTTAFLPARRSLFLSRVSTLTRNIDIAIMSVRLIVCLSVRDVPLLDENGLTYCYSFFTVR